jgi:hypothetical protein
MSPRIFSPRLYAVRLFLASIALLIAAGFVVDQRPARAGETAVSGYKVLDPISHGNLTIFPVVAAKTYPTAEFLTLDEGLRSGEVIVTEAGNVQGLIRRHPVPAIQHDGPQVNRLVLVNNSKHPLLLPAGEIVTGGKQDRVIGKDASFPPKVTPLISAFSASSPDVGSRLVSILGRRKLCTAAMGFVAQEHLATLLGDHYTLPWP